MSSVPLQAQIGGLGTFDFLNLSVSPRATAIGGAPIALADDDSAQSWANPALINSSMDKILSVHYNFHIGDIRTGFGAYGIAIDSMTAAVLSVNYID